MNPELQTLKARLQQLEEGCAQMKTQYEQSERRYHHAERRLRVQAVLAFCAVIGAILVSPANRAALAQGYGTTLQQLLARMTVVEGKTQFMSADATARSTTFTGCNVFIQNGLGATNGNPTDPLNLTTNTTAVNGLGNLIVGYNALRNDGTDFRTGSHNIIAGDANNYSSFGGLVAGRFNAISGAYASVSGGEQNTASGTASSVSGGYNNVASGQSASISGGLFNFASGNYSSVSGGDSNEAIGLESSVSGGLFIIQSNKDGWSAGGFSGAGVFHSP